MPDLYDAIASGSYGRSSDRWYREPDFYEITEKVEKDGEDEDYEALDLEDLE